MTTFFVEIAGKPDTRERIECSGYKIAAAHYAEFCQALEIGGELELDISLGGRDRPARVVVSHRPDGCFVVVRRRWRRP